MKYLFYNVWSLFFSSFAYVTKVYRKVSVLPYLLFVHFTQDTHTHSNTCIAYLFCIIMYLDANCANILQINQKQVRKKLSKYSYLTSTINTHSSQCGILLSDFYFILYFRFSHCFFLAIIGRAKALSPTFLALFIFRISLFVFRRNCLSTTQ